MFFNFQNSIGAHVGHIVFAILQIELYRVVDYDSNCDASPQKSTNVGKQ